MKITLFAFTVCFLFASCFKVDYVPLEEPILTWESLDVLQEGVEQIASAVGTSKGGGFQGHNGLFSSHSTRSMNLFMLFACEPSQCSELLQEFRLRLLETLEAKGASVLRNEDFADTQLRAPLEFSDTTMFGDETLRAKEWCSGFTIAYSKSKINGGVSVGFKVDLDGRNYLQVSQIENQ